MGFLLGTLLLFGRLSEDSEITAWRASGQHLLPLFWPVWAFAALASMYLVYFNSDIAPRAQNSFRALYREVLQQNPLVRLEEKAFLEVMKFRIYVDKKIEQTHELEGVHIYRTEDQAPPTRIYARTGSAEMIENKGIIFHLKNGMIQQFDPLIPTQTTITSFEKYDIQIPLELQSQNPRKNMRSMRSSEISAEIKNFRLQNLPVSYLKTEYHLRIAVACAPLAFALIGTVLGVRLEKGGKSIGVGVSLIIIFIYYLFLIAGITIGEKGFLPAWASLWMCNIIIGAVGYVLLYKTLKR
jgi:lipopolysaccharide export system permease protein